MPSEILKLTSAGSVDDGKSTLLARILLDTGSIFEDQLGANFDQNRIADLLDGLESERDQGITIDVAHRYFDSDTRRYQIADSPGHEQYTRNMATACAGSDALLIVIDALSGLKPQTLHHLEIALRLGIRQIIFAVNKMDLVSYKKQVFDSIAQGVSSHVSLRSTVWGKVQISLVPVSGLIGDNVVRRTSKMPWFQGPTLIQVFDELKVQPALQSSSSVFQAQYIQRISGGGRRYLGPLITGELQLGRSLHGTRGENRIKSIFANGVPVEKAKAGEQISLEFEEDFDIKRGGLLSSVPIASETQFDLDLIWLSGTSGRKGHSYIAKAGSAMTRATITRVHKLNLDTNEKEGEVRGLETNQILRAQLYTSEPLQLLPFSEVPEIGRLVLIDQEDGQTVAVGTVNFALRRSQNVTRQNYEVSNVMLSKLTGNKPKVVWFTGLSGSGKSTLANELSEQLFIMEKPHYVLDGDNLRLGINRDLGFSPEERTENIRRTAEVARLMADAGLIVLVAIVSPSERDRQMARSIIGDERFSLVFVDTPLEVCEQRDPKGLYKKARLGQLPNFTGVGANYERPEHPDFHVTNQASLQDLDWNHWLS